MNTYKVTFPFRGKYYFTQFTSDMLVNVMMARQDEAYADVVYSDDNEKNERYFEDTIWADGKKYTVTFALHDVEKFNVYECDEDYDETLVEKNIPWCMVKVVDGDNVNVYSVTEYI